MLPVKKLYIDSKAKTVDSRSTSDFSIDLSTGKVECLKKEDINWKITLVDTGMKTMTGGRVKRLKKKEQAPSLL